MTSYARSMPPKQHSPAADVERAIFALDDGAHPFTVRRNGDRIEAVWTAAARGEGVVFGTVEWRFRVTLLGETGEYTDSILAKNFDGAENWMNFRSTDVSRPVKAVLEQHGWTRRPNFFARLFGGRSDRTD